MPSLGHAPITSCHGVPIADDAAQETVPNDCDAARIPRAASASDSRSVRVSGVARPCRDRLSCAVCQYPLYGVGPLRLVSLFRVRSHPLSVLVAGAIVALGGCAAEDVAVPPPPVDRLVFRAAPEQTVAGVAFDPAVQVFVLREDGALDESSTLSVSLRASSGSAADTLRGITSVAAVAGVATFPAVSLSRVSEDVRLFARAAGLTGAESGPIRVVAGAATQLVFLTQPDSAIAGQPLPALRIQLRDVAGNRVVSGDGPVTVAVSSGPAGASITGTITADLVSGEALLDDVRLPRAGTGYTLTASLIGSAGVRSPVTRVFNTSPAVPAELAYVSEPTASTVGFPITPAVRVAVLDRFGNIVTSASAPVSLELAVAAAGSQLGGVLTVTPTAGIATFATVRLDRPSGTVRLRASAAGLSSVVSAAFEVEAP
jgi:hypothetical protein